MTRTESQVARMLSTGIESPDRDRYEADKQAWIARQLVHCPPLSARHKQIIRTAFAAHREQADAA